MNKRDLEKEFESKYKDYGRMLFRTAYLYVGNSADAEDILQEVFMKYLSGKYRFKDAEHEKAWFIRVTINGCKDILKSFFRTKTVSLEEALSLTEPIAQDHRDVLEQVLALPQKYKEVVFLHYYDGYSAPEIGRILRKNTNTVYTLLNRSREMLRTELEKEGYHG